ncbi:MAG: HupE/UreJ family protein [Caulobacterales bacterium]|nr:HupE/UreJ family protein [Caulobacterales bacterium]
MHDPPVTLRPRPFGLWIIVALLAFAAPAATAHPLANTLITLKPDSGRIALEIDSPAADLTAAMQAEGAAPTPLAVQDYYRRHVALTDSGGAAVPLAAVSATLIEATDPEVGAYREWRTRLIADTSAAAPGVYSLGYDAVIHQIPNHFAMVRLDGGRSEQTVGVIRYDFAAATIHPLLVDLADGGLTSGFMSMIAVGFVHVLTGLDHILFLAALLMVAPFEVAGGRWRFRGMDRKAAGRFAAISGAFTLGHSASLAAGTFGFDLIPVRLTEILVAASIVVAAVHALRPLFPRREWLVAGGFGLIHGLAFSETLAALNLGLKAKIGALFGFNIGVELAQLAVMVVALPLLMLGGSKALVRPRQAALALIAIVATLWIGERAFGLPLPVWLTADSLRLLLKT